MLLTHKSIFWWLNVDPFNMTQISNCLTREKCLTRLQHASNRWRNGLNAGQPRRFNGCKREHFVCIVPVIKASQRCHYDERKRIGESNVEKEQSCGAWCKQLNDWGGTIKSNVENTRFEKLKKKNYPTEQQFWLWKKSEFTRFWSIESSNSYESVSFAKIQPTCDRNRRKLYSFSMFALLTSFFMYVILLVVWRKLFLWFSHQNQIWHNWIQKITSASSLPKFSSIIWTVDEILF